ncbi:MAG: hypothetical protein COA36_12740 [Desulfotalea sp.]|nr:MAG: hypothetical protein COA36_12740 [Desulfotalea sp.]
MTQYPILEICARVEGHPVQWQILRQHCRQFKDWQDMLKYAEREGMAPLLRKHLLESGADIPTTTRRSLSILHQRHQKKAAVRLTVLGELLVLLQQHQITPILIKGAALCQTLYPDPALRPMRDIDILLSRDEVDQAQELLRNVGFTQSTAAISPDHYHLPSLQKTVEDVQVCIELHRGLYPNCPPYYPKVDFNNLLQSGRKITIGGTEVATFNHEETLHYLYQHGFRSPLTYEKFKLVNAADIIGFTEAYFQEIDWQRVQKQYPQLYKALPLMHHISPWNFEKIPESFISLQNRKRRLPPRPFNGWPQRRVKELQRTTTLKNVLKATLLPSHWWLGVYYGAGYSTGKYIKALCFSHLKNIFWWLHMYTPVANEKDTASIAADKKFAGPLRLSFITRFNRACGMLAKLKNLRKS